VPALRIANKDAEFDKREDVTQRCVPGERFASFAHFDVLSFPSKPSRRRFSASRYRAFSGLSEMDSHKRAMERTDAKVDRAPLMVRLKHTRNRSIQGVLSFVAFCVRSKMSQ
jgi:hypothetical protein